MKNNLIAILATICAAFIMTGCGSRALEDDEGARRIEFTKDSENAYMLRDRVTGVCYLVIGTIRGVTVTPMYNADGTLYTMGD